MNSEYKNLATAGAEPGVKKKEMPALLQTVPDEVLQVITGNILGAFERVRVQRRVS